MLIVFWYIFAHDYHQFVIILSICELYTVHHLILWVLSSFLLGRGVRRVPAMLAGSLLQQWDHQRGGHAKSNGLPSWFPLLAGSGSRTPTLSSILPNGLLLSRRKCCKYHFKGQRHHDHRWSTCQMINGAKQQLFPFLLFTRYSGP